MTPTLTPDHWIVMSVESDRIVLTGGDAATAIAELQIYDRRAMVKIGVDLRRFIFAPTGKRDDAYVSDLTVIEENGSLVITHGLQSHENERTRDVRSSFVHRTDDEILGKRAEFYGLVVKASAL